ncbi:hypothetical protein DSO57_1023906 [Entomophthora muscae]|uniref:Uncharacterized protein n=1 Tax=Entomophthora muscae TaxID=34485 RepID=A0ACC2T2X5_9FUNG|nr:hypothetical protein DSO57_1023906 [Entomophthora muscae]
MFDGIKCIGNSSPLEWQTGVAGSRNKSRLPRKRDASSDDRHILQGLDVKKALTHTCQLPIRRRILELSVNKELSIIRSELRKYCLGFPGVAITMFVGSSATATFSYRRVMLLLLTNPKSLDLKGSFQQCFPEEYSEVIDV